MSDAAIVIHNVMFFLAYRYRLIFTRWFADRRSEGELPRAVRCAPGICRGRIWESLTHFWSKGSPLGLVKKNCFLKGRDLVFSICELFGWESPRFDAPTQFMVWILIA